MPAALADRDVAVIVGGDGAVHLTAPWAAAANVPIYHCPAGTENVFARALGKSSSPSAVVAAIERGATRQVDLGEIEGEAFVLMASAGFDADVVHRLAARRRASIRHVSYVPPLLHATCWWRGPDVAISVDGAAPVELGRGLVIVATMAEYALRLNPARGALDDDGLLDAVFLPCRSGLGALGWALRLRASRGPLAGAWRARGRRFAVMLDRPVLWQCDGDPFGPAGAAARDTVTIGVSDRRLRILLPAPSETGRTGASSGRPPKKP